jgi:hypothetical protein
MSEYSILYRADQFPVFQNRMFASAEDAIQCQRGDIVLAQDCSSGLISNIAFQPELLVYDESYQNEQGVSDCFQSHLNDICGLIRNHFPSSDVIEIGCGKGLFMGKLRNAGFSVTGLDPTYEGDDQTVRRQFYGPELGLTANGIVLRHVLEHIQDPFRFLQLIAKSNRNTGRIYIEVPCFDWICKRRAFFDIFYEHVNYFRLSDFTRMFSSVRYAGHTFGGQYLSVIADLDSLRVPEFDLTQFAFPSDFRSSLDAIVENRLKMRDRARRQLVIWGAASKGVIFALLLQRAGVYIDAIVDINPAKQGYYVPATGLLVQSPKVLFNFPSDNTDIFVMNSNYITEVKTASNSRFSYLIPDVAEILASHE